MGDFVPNTDKSNINIMQSSSFPELINTEDCYSKPSLAHVEYIILVAIKPRPSLHAKHKCLSTKDSVVLEFAVVYNIFNRTRDLDSL